MTYYERFHKNPEYQKEFIPLIKELLPEQIKEAKQTTKHKVVKVNVSKDNIRKPIVISKSQYVINQSIIERQNYADIRNFSNSLWIVARYPCALK